MTAHRGESIRLTKLRRRIIAFVGGGVWLTGVLWLVFHHLLQRRTEFGTQASPLEFWWRASHGLFGFATLWTFGLLWGAHVVSAWRSGRHRLSGGAVVIVLTWLAMSGWLLYYLGDDAALNAVSLAHWMTGLTLPALYLAHRVRRRSRNPSACSRSAMLAAHPEQRLWQKR